ncbi:hypothetical protein A3Q56_07009 [Intoshia linei]|uniref:BTB domain-containing protein n=1 Tax=Intoshia linei TaxID=1819745 RepID=A0A177AVL4_9BILA|nr:hypothetical protein A3Q56_07009 [Intoshia linei]
MMNNFQESKYSSCSSIKEYKKNVTVGLRTECQSSIKCEMYDFTNSNTSTATLIVEDKEIYCHKEVLSVWSKVFKIMFSGDFLESCTNKVSLTDKKYSDVIMLLQTMYPPSTPIDESNVHILLPLIDEYQITCLRMQCENYFLNIKPSMDLLIIAQTYRYDQLLNQCIEFCRCLTLSELFSNPNTSIVHSKILNKILMGRVTNVDIELEMVDKLLSENRFGFVDTFADSYSNFCYTCQNITLFDECLTCFRNYKRNVVEKYSEIKSSLKKVL